MIQHDPTEDSYQFVCAELFPLISHCVRTFKHEEVGTVARNSLVLLASHLRAGNRAEDVLVAVLEMSHDNSDEELRGLAVGLLNDLAECLGRSICERYVVSQLVCLCEDPSYRVRTAVAGSMNELGKVLGPELSAKKLSPPFAKLATDSHWTVRKAAAEALSGFVETLDGDTKNESIVSLLDKLIYDDSSWVKHAARQQLGFLIPVMTCEPPERFLDIFLHMAFDKSTVTENKDAFVHVSYCLSAVLKTTASATGQLMENYTEKILDLMTECSQCAYSEAKRSIAAQLHEIANTVDHDNILWHVLPAVEALLQDHQDAQIFGALMKSLPKILEKLA